jgi:DNA-directed RNA polymerase specialized sigma24 family protein
LQKKNPLSLQEDQIEHKAAIKLRSRAHSSAIRYGFKRDAEDLAQDAICTMIEHPTAGRTVDQHVIDAVRKRYGRPGLPGFGARQNLECAIANGAESDARAGEPCPGISPGDRIDLERMLRHLGVGEERAFFLLRYQYGFKEIEIAHLYGLTKSRISQRLKGIQNRLQHIAREGEKSSRAECSRDSEITDSETADKQAEADLSFELDGLFTNAAF